MELITISNRPDTFNWDIESSLQRECLKAIRKRKDICCTKISDRISVGISDFLICKEGKFYAIELKVKNNTTTPLQNKFLNDVKEAGGVACVVRTVAEFKEVLNIK